MLIYFTILFLATTALSNCKTIKLNIPVDGKAIQLVPSSENSAGIAETEWIIQAKSTFKVRIFCRLQVKDCLRNMLTINNGRDEVTYCGKKAIGPILVTSHKNKMTVNLSTRDAANAAICLVSAIKSFVDFDEPEIDSSEAGVTAGIKGTTCQCGWSTKNPSRIVGGREAKINEYSFPVVIVRKDLKIAFCGGSVITPFHVLTAAHCTYKLKKDVPLVVGVGEHDLSSVKETNATQMIPVAKVINHENFDYESTLYDISILLLKDEIKFNRLVGPVCLPNKRINIAGEMVKAMGWGRLQYKGAQSNVLMKVDLKVINLVDCVEYYKKLRINDPNQFCTFGHDKDTCSGDSGGPVVWLDPETNRYTQMGVVSYGKSCASEDYPSVNTDISYFLDWIHKVIQETKPSVTCSKN